MSYRYVEVVVIKSADRRAPLPEAGVIVLLHSSRLNSGFAFWWEKSNIRESICPSMWRSQISNTILGTQPVDIAKELLKGHESHFGSYRDLSQSDSNVLVLMLPSQPQQWTCELSRRLLWMAGRNKLELNGNSQVYFNTDMINKYMSEEENSKRQ